MEMRLLLAFLLMGAVMFVTQLWFKPPESPQPAKKDQTAAVPKAGEPPSAAVTPPPATTAEAVPTAANPAATPEQPQPNFVIETDLFHVSFSNQGATVRSWLLKTYKGNDGKPLDLVNSNAGIEFPFSLYFPGQKPATDVNWTWYKQT